MRIITFLKNRKFYIAFIIFLILLTIVFIWSNSLRDRPQSKQQSEKVTEAVKPVVEPMVGKGNVTDNLVRKIAHFTEFCLLGCEFAALLIVLRSVKIHYVLNSLFAGMTVALFDETIQVFTKRGSQVKDVWLDFGGFLTGILLVLLTYKIINIFKNRSLVKE